MLTTNNIIATAVITPNHTNTITENKLSGTFYFVNHLNHQVKQHTAQPTM